eukprot:CAMPEP_0184686942 /NCGR_PEP_ID=MMETSP0312-20130426/24658_1 /TAXON_ID=31354 /ORGANISM="Compsopogon coeruleus, Strain SAG 36.94" /LENGTH=355 /DNA_ID=CAMNT_0027142569 /DNA_START=78 /DNA_END=1145 /DNA_ORIENTATION=+
MFVSAPYTSWACGASLGRPAGSRNVDSVHEARRAWIRLTPKSRASRTASVRAIRCCASGNGYAEDESPETKKERGPWPALAASLTAIGLGLASATIGTLTRGNGGLPPAGGERASWTSWILPQALAYSRYSKKSVTEKLAQVPVFAVTNSSGQPYLANMDGRHQVGLIFFSHEDANKMRQDMLKNPGSADARVYIMGLDKAYEMVRARPTPSGIRGPRGEEQTMVFRFYPDSKQVRYASQIARRLRYPKFEGVPTFVAKGLTITKGGESIIPLFFNKEDLEAAWTKLRETNKELPSRPVIDVANLLIMIRLMEEDENADLRNFGFFPPKESVEYVQQEQAGNKGQARMHQNPLQH